MEPVQLLAYGCFDCWELHISCGEKTSRHSVASFRCREPEQVVLPLIEKFKKAKLQELDEVSSLFLRECWASIEKRHERETAGARKLLQKYERAKKRHPEIIRLREAISNSEREKTLSFESFV